MSYSPYPEYRDSGVQWLGEVPAHWEVKRLKTSAGYRVSNVDKLTRDNELPVRLCNYTDVYYNEQIAPCMDLMEATATKEEVERFQLKVDDIVITKDSEDWRDIAVPARVAAAAPDLICGYHLAIISPIPTKLNGRFLLRAFQSCAVNQQFQVAASGVTRYGLPKSSIGEATLPFPPLLEQTAIADFLDRETGHIDTLVAKKRRLIKLLREQRTALISRTVTRGLPADVAREFDLEPHTRFRDSGIEWLGDVPQGWEVKPYKRVTTRVDVGIAEAATHAYCDDGVPIVRSTNVKPNRLDLRGLLHIEPWFAEKNRSKTLRAGDLVTVRTGYPGTTAMIPDDLDGSQCFTLVISTPRNDCYGSFLSWYMNSDAADKYFRLEGWGSAQINISVPIVQFLPIPVPLIKEQIAIADFLDRETARIDRLVEKVEAAIDRLQEYRSALITAAVTGKIDVRRAAKQDAA